MLTDPLLIGAWLLLAHLLAASVAEEAMGRVGTRAVVRALLMLPAVVVFGIGGLIVVAGVVVLHFVVDAAAGRWIRRAEETATPRGGTPPSDEEPEAALDRAWTPVPAAIYVLGHLVQVVVLAAAAVLLARLPVNAALVEVVSARAGGFDAAMLGRLVLALPVLASLVVVNVRLASVLIELLLHPRSAAGGDVQTRPVTRADPPADEARAYTVRVGPVTARVAPDALPAPPPTPDAPSPARLGEAIGVLERLLIVALVLVGAVASIGLVIAAKTLARFKQLDDRDFAEYYLLGTLASTAIAVITALVAAAVLA